MNHKPLFLTVALIALLVIAGAFWYLQYRPTAMNQPEVKTEGPEDQRENVITETAPDTQTFVTDIDRDIRHWQTKETEFFTMKFPKEWYRLNSVITNNPNFDIDKYADIGIFSGGKYPLLLEDETEVVISFSGSATSDAGTPQDSLDAIFKLAKQNDPSVDCKVTNNKAIPFTAYCTATYDSQLHQSYYVINNKISLVLTARTTKDTLVKKDILDKIAGSIILK